MPRMRVAGWSRFVIAILVGVAAAGCQETNAQAPVSPLQKSVSVAQQHEPAGHYPHGYSVVWDATKKEYRIAITGLTWRE